MDPAKTMHKLQVLWRKSQEATLLLLSDFNAKHRKTLLVELD